MKKRVNIEKEIKKLYKTEAEEFNMLPEDQVTVIREARNEHKITRSSIRTIRYTAVLSFVLVAAISIIAVSFSLQKPDSQNTPPSNDTVTFDSGESDSEISDMSEDNNISYTDSCTATETRLPNLALLSLDQWLDDPDVIWKEGSDIKGNETTDLSVKSGNILITDELKSEFEKHTADTVYAVMVDFSSMKKQDFSFDGKMLSEWTAEIEKLTSQGNDTEAKAIAQKISQAKEEYYFKQLETFKENFASMGLGIYHEKYGCTIDKCIFYTFATRSQIEEFKCNADQAFIFAVAVRFK